MPEFTITADKINTIINILLNLTDKQQILPIIDMVRALPQQEVLTPEQKAE